jgi:hypothetical protein
MDSIKVALRSIRINKVDDMLRLTSMKPSRCERHQSSLGLPNNQHARANRLLTELSVGVNLELLSVARLSPLLGVEIWS